LSIFVNNESTMFYSSCPRSRNVAAVNQPALYKRLSGARSVHSSLEVPLSKTVSTCS